MKIEKKHRFPYEWTLKDAIFTKDKGKVFSCFACGGGSTMGYKLAGFDVIGCNEIDPKMMEVYKTNHNPKYAYLEPIQTFKTRKDLPRELYDLDILDGSPPCSSFSMAGNREKDWGKEKKFKEGQSKQVLDTLFFDFIDLAKELQPKIVIAENVKGILMGDARKYVRKILEDFNKAGYVVQEFCLNSNRMGIPQKRERVFFIAIRKDLLTKLPKNISLLFNDFPLLNLIFFEPLIKFSEIYEPNNKERMLTEFSNELWQKREFGDSSFEQINERVHKKENMHFNKKFLYKHKVPNTVTGKDDCVLFDEPRHRSKLENLRCSSFPLDYNFLENKEYYLMGMSVPPLMTAQIATEIYNQWISKL